MTGSHGSEHGEVSPAGNLTESNSFYNTVNGLTKIFDGPATLFRKIIESTRTEQPYYHRVYKRVPTVDECAYKDLVCIQEANEQYQRDRKVDKFITQILADRAKECYVKEGPYDGYQKCRKLDEDHELAVTNYYIKYGDLAQNATCVDAYMKQKHRLIWQRRNPDKDIVGLEKRKEFVNKIGEYQRAAVDNPHKN